VQHAPGCPIDTPTKGVSPNTGPLAAAAWLLARGLTAPDARWNVEILLGTSEAHPDEDAPTLLRVELFSEEWGFWFRHEDRVSWIRVTDLRFAHGRDEHEMLRATPALKDFGSLVHAIEARFDISFRRESAAIRTSLRDADAAIRAWIGDW
jgi:hypothetical protein